MRKVSLSAEATKCARPGSCRETREGRANDRAKKRPPKPSRSNSVVAKHKRPTMKKIKAHSLTGRITPKLMRQAFQKVKRNRGAAGVDKVSVEMFAKNLDENLDALMRDLKSGTFRTRPLRRVRIPKGPGTTKLRPLGIPVVRDRVAQEVLRRLLAPIFEPQFHENSFGFIRGRNCHQALERALEYHTEGDRVVLDADIQGFFDNIPHRVIVAMVASEVADGNILRLVEKFLTAGVMEDGVFKPTNIGTPQGGVISPLLANIVLNKLDWRLHDAGYRFVRYADDFVVVCRTKRQAQEALQLVRDVLEGELELRLKPRKDGNHDVRERLRLSRISIFVQVAPDTGEIRAEIQSEDTGINRTPS